MGINQGNGCCRFHQNITVTWPQIPRMSVAGCLQMCNDDPLCVAADMWLANGGSTNDVAAVYEVGHYEEDYICTHFYQGAPGMDNFHIACDGNRVCYRRECVADVENITNNTTPYNDTSTYTFAAEPTAASTPAPAIATAAPSAAVTPSPAPATLTPEPACMTCKLGDSCFVDIAWVMQHGVRLHPNWYSSGGGCESSCIDESSCFEDVQLFLFERQQKDKWHWNGMHTDRIPLPCGKQHRENYIIADLLYCR